MPKIQLANIRLKHATNSSSSHSFIWLPDALLQKIKPQDTEDSEFGWQFFTTVSKEAKRNYLAIALISALYDMPEYAQKLIVEDMTGLDYDRLSDGYIDHQSKPTLPVDYHDRSLPDRDFYKAFEDWLTQDNLLILGGNDNTSEVHPLSEHDESKELDVPIIEGYSGMSARFDPTYQYWTLFNADSGAKIRFRFEYPNAPELPAITRSFAPELVDMKITDYCGFGCKYCYMGSTKEGKHADKYYIYDCIDILSELKVQEIALGGGEPTEHPDFMDILHYAKRKGLSVAFTTKNLALLEDKAKLGEITETVAAFAMSISNARQLKEIEAALIKADVHRSKVNAHVVMGTVDRSEFRDILHASIDTGIRLTLLGFKTTGRGKEYKKVDYPWWITEIKAVKEERNRYFGLSIDTVLAKEYEIDLQKAGVSNLFYHTEDGLFSAYIDAVEQKMARASYVEPAEHLALSRDTESRFGTNHKLKANFLRIYQAF